MLSHPNVPIPDRGAGGLVVVRAAQPRAARQVAQRDVLVGFSSHRATRGETKGNAGRSARARTHIHRPIRARCGDAPFRVDPRTLSPQSAEALEEPRAPSLDARY